LLPRQYSGGFDKPVIRVSYKLIKNYLGMHGMFQ
jgi:hypothetical protein